MDEALVGEKSIIENKLYFSCEDNVSYPVRAIFKKYSLEYPRSFWKKLGKKYTHLIFQYWLQHQSVSIEFDWIIKKEFLGLEEVEWNNYIERFKSHSGVEISLDKQSFAIVGEKRQKLEKMFEEAKLLEAQ